MQHGHNAPCYFLNVAITFPYAQWVLQFYSMGIQKWAGGWGRVSGGFCLYPSTKPQRLMMVFYFLFIANSGTVSIHNIT